MRELVLHFAPYYGWPKVPFLNTMVEEQYERVLAETEADKLLA